MISEIIKRLQHIDALIQEHKTGSAAEMGEVIGVSERTVYKYLKIMKKIGAPIAFNACARTYYYETEGCFVCAFSLSTSNDQHKRDGLETMKLSMVSISELLLQMNMNMMLHNN